MNQSLGLPFGIYVADNTPLDGKLGVFASGTWRVWNSTAEVVGAIPVGARHQGLTVNVAGVEYWWQVGTADNQLVAKNAGGGGGGFTLTNGLGTLANGTSVNIGGALGADIVLDGTFGIDFGLNTVIDHFTVNAAGFSYINSTGGLQLSVGFFQTILLSTGISSSPGYIVLGGDISSAGIMVTMGGGPNTDGITATIRGAKNLAGTDAIYFSFDPAGILNDPGAIFVDTRVATKGIQYAAAGYVTDPRSLTDKAYVDAAVGASFTASNGITKTGSNFALGGTLSSSVTIALASQFLTFSSAGGTLQLGGVNQDMIYNAYAGSSNGYRIFGYYSGSLFTMKESSTSGTPSFGLLSSKIGNSAQNKYSIFTQVGDYTTPALSGFRLQTLIAGVTKDKITVDLDGNLAINLGSDADGDLFIRSGGYLVRIPKGNTGQVLTQGVSLAAWSDIAGPFADNVALLKNVADPTKRAIVDVSNVPTGTTNTYKVPAQSGNLILDQTAYYYAIAF